MLKFVSLFFGFFIIIFASHATTINVPSDYDKIQDAIDFAVAEDTILIADGIYTGEGNRDLVLNGKIVTIISANGPDNCIIDCDGSVTDPHFAFEFGLHDYSNSSVQGLTIINAYNYNKGAVHYSDSAYVLLRNCVIRDNLSYAGITVWSGARPYVYDCIIKDNVQHGIVLWDGIYMKRTLITGNGGSGLYHTSHNGITWMENCTFVLNGESGVDLFGDPPKAGEKAFTDSAVFTNCLSAFNGDYGFTRTFYLPPVHNHYCNSFGNGIDDFHGLLASPGDDNGNMSADPLFCDSATGNFTIEAASPCASANNESNKLIGAYDVGCYTGSRSWIVTVTGGGDAPTIQGAIDLAANFDSVLVGAGTYTGDGNRDLDFHGKNIKLLSFSGAQSTIIDCEGSMAEHHLAINLSGGENHHSEIFGFTFTNAYSDQYGALNFNHATATIRDCRIMNNESSGIKFYDSYGDTAYVENCIINSNSMHGLDAIGITLFADNLEVAGNGQNGVSMLWNGTLYLTGSLIYYNAGYGVHGLTMYAPFYITSNTIVGNGSGIVWWASYPKERDDNMAKFAIPFDVTQNIVAFNTEYGISAEWDYNDATDSITHCNNVYGNPSGDYYGIDNYGGDAYHNISADPLFCDTTEINFHINYHSPCQPDQNFCGELIGALPADCGLLCGDLNNNGLINILDITYLINCLYGTGPCPPGVVTDVNGDGMVNLLDITYLISFLYMGGDDLNCNFDIWEKGAMVNPKCQ